MCFILPYARPKRVQGHEFTTFFPTTLCWEAVERGAHWSTPDVQGCCPHPSPALWAAEMATKTSGAQLCFRHRIWPRKGSTLPPRTAGSQHSSEDHLHPIDRGKIQHKTSLIQVYSKRWTASGTSSPFLSPARNSCPHITLLSKLFPLALAAAESSLLKLLFFPS